MKGWWEESREETERPVPAAGGGGGGGFREKQAWLDVHADQEYVLQVNMRRVNTGQQRVSGTPADEGLTNYVSST